MAKRYWPPAIPSFTAGCKELQKESVCLPLRFIGDVNNVYKSTHEHEDDVYEFSWHDSRVLSLGSQGSGSVQDVFSFRMREQINLQIFFWSWKRDISILLMLRKSKTNDPTKSQSCFSENKLLCFHGQRCLDWFPKMRFLPWLLTVKVQLFSLPSHSSPV